MRRFSYLAIILAIAMTAAACGGSGGSPSPTPARTASTGGITPAATAANTGAPTTAGDNAAAEAAAQDALLTGDDLPSGWNSSPHTEADLQGLTGDCQSLNTTNPFPGDVANGNSDDFIGPDDQTVSSSAAVFASAAAAKDAMDGFTSTFSTCRQQLTDAFDAMFKSQFEQGAQSPNIQTSFEPLSLPQQDEETSGYRLTLTVSLGGVTFQPTIDFALIRQGKMLGGFFYLAIQPNQDEEETLLAKVGDKLKAAEAALQ